MNTLINNNFLIECEQFVIYFSVQLASTIHKVWSMIHISVIFLILYFMTHCQITSLSFKSIILSSFAKINTPHFTDVFKNMLGEKKGHLVYIPTAQYATYTQSSKSRGEQRRRARYDARQKLQGISSALDMQESEILELDSPNLCKNKLSEILNGASVLYVDGGNTFYLQKFILQTNFWSIAKNALHNNCVYIGASAGGIVAGRSIETAYWKGWDDPVAAGESYVWSKEKLQGGDICNGNSFFMHFDENCHKDLISSKSAGLGNSLKTIADTEARVFYSATNNGALPLLHEAVYNFDTNVAEERA